MVRSQWGPRIPESSGKRDLSLLPDRYLTTGPRRGYDALVNKIPCTCPACLILIDLSLALGALGAFDEAEIVAQKVTWIDPSTESEGYTETWSRPIPPADSVEWN